jgi:hypothetical protein
VLEKKLRKWYADKPYFMALHLDVMYHTDKPFEKQSFSKLHNVYHIKKTMCHQNFIVFLKWREYILLFEMPI